MSASDTHLAFVKINIAWQLYASSGSNASGSNASDTSNGRKEKAICKLLIEAAEFLYLANMTIISIKMVEKMIPALLKRGKLYIFTGADLNRITGIYMSSADLMPIMEKLDETDEIHYYGNRLNNYFSERICTLDQNLDHLPGDILPIIINYMWTRFVNE